MALDDSGHTPRFEGGTWQAPQSIPTHRGIVSIACAAPDRCVALDGGANGFVYQKGRWGGAAPKGAKKYPSSEPTTGFLHPHATCGSTVCLFAYGSRAVTSYRFE